MTGPVGDAVKGASRLMKTVAKAADKSFFEGARYTTRVQQDMSQGVGEFHSFPDSVIAFEKSGTVSTITGAERVVRELLEIPGTYATRSGTVVNGVFSVHQGSGRGDQPQTIHDEAISMSDPYVDLLAEKGISLSNLEIGGRALVREDALNAVQILRRLSLPILGGDVYFEYSGRIEPAYCNWFVEQMEGEPLGEFTERSCEHTRQYIERFPESLGKITLFALVAQE